MNGEFQPKSILAGADRDPTDINADQSSPRARNSNTSGLQSLVTIHRPTPDNSDGLHSCRILYALKETFKMGERRRSETTFTETRPKTETIKAFSRRTFHLLSSANTTT